MRTLEDEYLTNAVCPYFKLAVKELLASLVKKMNARVKSLHAAARSAPRQIIGGDRGKLRPPSETGSTFQSARSSCHLHPLTISTNANNMILHSTV